MTREELLKLCVDHIAAHSCVSSCCGAQPSAGEAKQLAECLRRRFSDDSLEQPHADKVVETVTTADTGMLVHPATDGDLWSFLRSVLEQGVAIQQDYAAGKYESYEHYAIRVDGAARERVEQLRALLTKAMAKPQT